MARIFISYRRADSRQVTGRIYDRLVSTFGKENVFKDVDNIPPGSDFRGVLAEAVAGCDVVLAVIGPQWLTITDDLGNRRLDNPGDFVQIELETALHRDSCVTIPILVDNARMPSAGDLPGSLRELAFKNAVTVREDPDFHSDMTRLITALKNRFTEPVTVPVPDRTAKRLSRGPWLLGAMIAILLIVVVISVINALSGGDNGKTQNGATGTPAAQAHTPEITTAAPVIPPETQVPLDFTATHPATLTQVDTLTPTRTESPIPTQTETPTLEIVYIVQTSDAETTIEAATLSVQETAAVRATEYSAGIQNSMDQTASATLWTFTPTQTVTNTPNRTPIPTLTSVPTETRQCTVHTEQSGIDVRVGPGQNRGIRSSLPVNQDIIVIGQMSDYEGNLWWKILPPGYETAEADRYWVAAADVERTGNCDQIPETEASEVIFSSQGAGTITYKGTLAINAADTYYYEGDSGEVLDIYLKADKPANTLGVLQSVQDGLMDTRLWIYMPSGGQLAYNDDVFDDGTIILTDSAILNLVLPVDGTYQIRVGLFPDRAGGEYTLTITPKS